MEVTTLGGHFLDRLLTDQHVESVEEVPPQAVVLGIVCSAARDAVASVDARQAASSSGKATTTATGKQTGAL